MGPRPSIVGTPRPLVVLPSEAPPVAASWRLEAQASRDVDGVLHEPAGRLGPLHGPVPRQQLDVGARVSHGGRVGDGADGRLDGLQLGPPHGSDVDLERGALGDDVRPRPALHDADVDADARKAPVERVKGDGLVRGLQDGAASLLRFDTRVGRASVDGEAEHQVALARGHDVAVLAGPLEDEGGIRTPCLLLDEGRARGRADLLVRVGDEDEATDGQPLAATADRPGAGGSGERASATARSAAIA